MEVKYELHHFADVSQLAYGGASYMRTEDNNGNIFCSFLMGKGFVAPSGVTIPRLELQAAAAIVRLDKFLRSELLLPIDNSFFWSDSMAVLKSIANSKKKFPVYVANRIAEIERNTHIENWRHVPTKLNHADEVSRGVQANKFVKKSKWLSGPDFLRLPTQEWPNQQAPPEEESTIVSNVTTTKIASASEFGLNRMICYYSSFERLKRGVAWKMKFCRFFIALSSALYCT